MNLNDLQHLASLILGLQRRGSPIVMMGELTRQVGPDGYQEALQRRWLIQDAIDGVALIVTPIRIRIEEMTAIANQRMPDDLDVGDSVLAADGSGRSVEAVIKSRSDTGEFELEYPDKINRPPRRFKKQELKLVGRRMLKPDSNVRPVDPNQSPGQPPSQSLINPRL